MKTLYNLTLSLEQRPEYVPEETYIKLLSLFNKAGLIGEKHVDYTGKILEGKISSCKLSREGEFEGNYHIIWGSSDKTNKIIKETFEEKINKVENLEEITLFSNPHIHTKDNFNYGMIRFLKPKEEGYYDKDVLKGYIQNINSKKGTIELRLEEIKDMLSKDPWALNKKIKIYLEKRKLENSLKKFPKSSFYKFILNIMNNPNQINRIPKEIKNFDLYPAPKPF